MIPPESAGLLPPPKRAPGGPPCLPGSLGRRRESVKAAHCLAINVLQSDSLPQIRKYSKGAELLALHVGGNLIGEAPSLWRSILRARGVYTVTYAATDLGGNREQAPAVTKLTVHYRQRGFLRGGPPRPRPAPPAAFVDRVGAVVPQPDGVSAAAAHRTPWPHSVRGTVDSDRQRSYLPWRISAAAQSKAPTRIGSRRSRRDSGVHLCESVHLKP